MTADELLQGMPELHATPLSVGRLLHILHQPVKSGHEEDLFKEVTETIEYDPSLTARLLKLANSNYSAGHETMFSVEQVVQKLGYNEIMQLATALSVDEHMVDWGAGLGENPFGLWEHSITTAVAARYLTENYHTTKVPSSEAFTAGMLHDVGKIVFRQLPWQVVELLKKRGGAEPDDSIEIEQAVLGTNHAEVGGRLLEKWQLPQAIVQAVLSHHAPEPGFRPTLTETVYVADRCACLKNSTDPGEILMSNFKPDIVKMMGMQPEQIRAIIDHIRSETKRIEVFMKAA